MKIIQLSAFFLPRTGGAEQHILNLCKELQKNAYEVEVMCSDTITEKEKRSKKIETIQGIKITRYKTILNLTNFSKIFPGFVIDLLKKDYDILHVHSYRQPYTLMGLFVAKIRGKKCILTTHAPFHPKGTRSKFFDFLRKIYDIFLGRLTTKFDHIIGINKRELDFFQKKGVKKNKLSIIPNGITQKEFQKGDGKKFRKDHNINPKQKIVLSIGRIEKTKGLQNLKYSIDKLKDVLFVFVGPDDGYLSYLKKLFQKNKNVLFTGKINHEETIDAYAAAEVFVFPSSYEAFGISLLEAMAQQVPVISTNRGGPNDFVEEEFGFLIDPNDQKEWFTKIEFLLNNKKRKKMGLAARKKAEDFLWENLIKDIIKIYKRL